MKFIVARASILIPREDHLEDDAIFKKSLEDYSKETGEPYEDCELSKGCTNEYYIKNKPCDEAVLQTVRHIKHKLNDESEYDEAEPEVKRWIVEFNTLEELLEFRKKYDFGSCADFGGQIDIERVDNIEGDYLLLVIHDDWRE
jgi:negative regulator of genetic competence, sporulation and motility